MVARDIEVINAKPLTTFPRLLVFALNLHDKRLFLLVIISTALGPVPINDQVKVWELAHLPEDWKAKRRRWDVQNAARVVLIGLAFLALVLSFRTLPLHG